MKIALAQIAPIIGDFGANFAAITAAFKRAEREGARLLVTPELALCGYPPHDLIERPEMFDRSRAALDQIVALTAASSCAIAVGHVDVNPSSKGKAAQNVVSIAERGKIVFRQAKALLPTYDIFDEARYFEPSPVNDESIKLWNCDGLPVAMAVCEDLWGQDTVMGRRLYGDDPVEIYRKKGAKLVISISSSPYEWNKRERREQVHAEVATRLGCPLVYVNQTGGNDEVLFDGASFVMSAEGSIIARLPFFEAAYQRVDVGTSDRGPIVQPSAQKNALAEMPAEIEVLHRGLVVGIRDYFARTGFKKALLGLSGGIDSAVVAVLAAEALGRENVEGIAMPSQFSSGHSLEDAEILAKRLGIKFGVRPIKFMYSALAREIAGGVGAAPLAPLALENLQSRLRGLMLMTLSNHSGALVLTTGNKSEIAMGYCTLYGDMAGALAPIGDLFKTRVYELARHLNQVSSAPIPERTLTKAPSAELRPDQTDQDSLPPYDQLDGMLEAVLEQGASVEQARQKWGPVVDSLSLLEATEYKRRQAAPVLRVSPKAFGMGRRVPIAKQWRL